MSRTLSLALCAMSALLAAACSPALLLGAMQPVAQGGETRDVAYLPGPRHTMDLYFPDAAVPAPPTVVFFYGGGWRSGEKETYRFVGRSLAACGAIVAIPDYRVWPDAGFDGFMADAAAAAATARREGLRHGADPRRFVLMGHSAGAHIATLLALNPAWLAPDARAAVSGVIGLAGPYDFLPLNDEVLEKIFAPVGPRTQPIAFASGAIAPMLLATGAEDTTVLPGNSIRLGEQVRAAGGLAETIVYQGIGHVQVAAALAAPVRFLAPVRADICRFLGLADAP